MIERNRTEERDEVLFAFHVACESPTPEFVDEWVRRYPQYEDDFRQHAGILAARLVEAQVPQLEPDETMLARGRSRALNAVYNAEIEARVKEAGSVGTFPAAFPTRSITTLFHPSRPVTLGLPSMPATAMLTPPTVAPTLAPRPRRSRAAGRACTTLTVQGSASPASPTPL